MVGAVLSWIHGCTLRRVRTQRPTAVPDTPTTPCVHCMHAGIANDNVLHLVRGKSTGNTQR